MTTHPPSVRAGLGYKLAWASIGTWALSILSVLPVAIEEYVGPPPVGEMEGMAAAGAGIMSFLILLGGSLLGTIFAVIALRRGSRTRVAWTGLILNAITLAGVIGFVLWVMFLQGRRPRMDGTPTGSIQRSGERDEISVSGLRGREGLERADQNEQDALLAQVVQLVARTPCARAKGAIEVRPIAAINDAGSGSSGLSGS